MSLHVCVLGIDGSGKSTVAAGLPRALAGELGVAAASAGDAFRLAAPGEPRRWPVSALLARLSRCAAKRLADRRALYLVFKLAQMLLQDHAAHAMGRRLREAVVVSDGNFLLSSLGRAADYLHPGGDPLAAPSAGEVAAILDFVLGGAAAPAPERFLGARALAWARASARLLRLARVDAVWLPDVAVFLDASPRTALARIAARGRRVDWHENEASLAQARAMYLRTLDAFGRIRGRDAALRVETDGLTPEEGLCAVAAALRPRCERTQRIGARPV